MTKTLKDLYYGNLTLFDHSIPSGSPIRKLSAHLTQCETKLKEQLGPEEKTLLEGSSLEEVKNNDEYYLNSLYVRYHKEAEEHPEMDDEAREWFKRIEDGDSEATAYFDVFKEVTMRAVGKVYDRLKIHFDSYAGESFYNDKMEACLDILREKNLLVESEGAQVVNLDEYNMPPCLLVKADGATLYATRDIAAAYYRKKTYDFDKCLYVVAYQQNLHFKQLFKVLELAELPWAKDMVHVAYGMVSLEDGAMSTRKGNVVLLRDVIKPRSLSLTVWTIPRRSLG